MVSVMILILSGVLVNRLVQLFALRMSYKHGLSAYISSLLYFFFPSISLFDYSILKAAYLALLTSPRRSMMAEFNDPPGQSLSIC